MKVAVIVDDLDPARRRRCFWEDRLSEFENVECELVSLLERMDRRKFFDIYQFDVVIFNWCLLDGALMYGSDRVQQIVEFFDDHYRRFVRQGRILIVENQPKRWHPAQRAYDVLFKGEMQVNRTESQVWGDSVVVNPRLAKHPLVRHLHSPLHSNYPYAESESWFPLDSTSRFSLDELHSRKMYSGSFRRWKSDWLPVLLDKDGSSPVMLLKVDEYGLYVVTTMYLASSNNHGLLDALLNGWALRKEEVRNFHARRRRQRMQSLVRLGLVFVVVSAGVFAAFATHIINAPDTFGGTVIGDIVVTIALGIAAVGLTFLRRYLGKLVRDMRNQ